MNKHKTLLKLICISFCFCLLSNSSVQAQVATFDSLSLELTVSDQIVCIPSDTPSYDPIWAQAGITDVSSEKDDLSDMGGQAIFYDPDTDTLVRLLSKTSSESQDIFNLNIHTEEERQNFYDTMMVNNDESTTITVEEYPQSELPFFRMSIQVDNNGSHQEIIYGTIVNGTMIYFDWYTEEKNATIDESLLQSLVAGTHFTKQYTQEEYHAIKQQGLVRIALYVFGILAVIIVLVIISNRKKKANALLRKKRTDALYQYYTNKKEKEALGKKPKLLFENQTTYSEQVIRQFCNYTYYQKKLFTWVITTILCIFSLVFLYKMLGLSLQLLMIAAIIIGIFVYQYFRVDKLCTNLWKPYASSKNKVADFHFYEDHFTMTGIQAFTEYPYLQLTSVDEHRGYIYLYFGTERAVYLSKDGFTTNADEFVAFIKEYLKSTN